MPGAIILENEIKLYIGDSVAMSLPRILEVAAAALAGIGSEGNYFLAAVKQETKGENMMSPADQRFGLYGIVIEATRYDGKPTLHLSAVFPTETLKRLKDEGKIV